MHPKNIHKKEYDFDLLQECYPQLSEFVFINSHEKKSIDFSNAKAVFRLNKALLIQGYAIKNWELPDGYLCPPIPGRADYIHHISDLIERKNNVLGLDIGVGANCIYPILGARIYNWYMTGVDIDETAINYAKKNSKDIPQIDIRHQTDNASIFKGILKEGETFDFSMCNPPFYRSEKDATKATIKKNTALHIDSHTRNFSGQSHELWCNGGEALFIKRMIKQSVSVKDQIRWFTCLVSKKEHLPKIYKQLDKLKITRQTIPMSQGNKESRFIAWTFTV